MAASANVLTIVQQVDGGAPVEKRFPEGEEDLLVEFLDCFLAVFFPVICTTWRSASFILDTNKGGTATAC